MIYRIEIECIYCKRKHVHSIDIGTPPRKPKKKPKKKVK